MPVAYARKRPVLIYYAGNRIRERRRLDSVKNHCGYSNLPGIRLSSRFGVHAPSQQIQIAVTYTRRRRSGKLYAHSRLCCRSDLAVDHQSVFTLKILDCRSRFAAPDTVDLSAVIPPVKQPRLHRPDICGSIAFADMRRIRPLRTKA